MLSVVRGLTRALGSVSGLAVLAIMALTLVDVVLRKVTGQGVRGVIEITEVTLVIAVFLALGSAQAGGVHISTSVLTSRLRVTSRRTVRVSAAAVALVTVAVMIMITTSAALNSFASGEYRFGLVRVPIWPARVAIVLGLVLFFIEYLRTVAGYLKSPEGARGDLRDAETDIPFASRDAGSAT